MKEQNIEVNIANSIPVEELFTMSSSGPYLSNPSMTGVCSTEEECLPTQQLTDKHHGVNLLHSLNLLRRDDILCDYTINTQEFVTKVHKCILAASSDYFKVMFLGNLKESSEDEITLQDLPSSALEDVINFMYTGKLTLSFTNVSGIIHVASILQVSSALHLTSSYLTDNMTFDNCESLLDIAHVYALTSVIEFYEKKVCKELEYFSSTAPFQTLTCDQLCRYLTSDSVQVDSESVVLTVALKWLMLNPTCGDVERVLTTVRYALMSASELSSVLIQPPFAASKEWFESISCVLKMLLPCPAGGPIQCPLPAQERVRCGEQAIVFLSSTVNGTLRLTALSPANKPFVLGESVNSYNEIRVTQLDDMIYLLSSVENSEWSLFERFDTRTLTFYSLAQPPTNRMQYTLSSCRGNIFLIGGKTPRDPYCKPVYRFSPKENTWHSGPSLPYGRYSHAAVVLDDSIYVSGGMVNMAESATLSNSCMLFNVVKETWMDVCSMNHKRRLHELVAFKGKLYAFGGMLECRQLEVAVECYCPTTDQWSLLSLTSVTGSSFGHFVVLQEKVLCVGREHKEAMDGEIWYLNVDKELWELFSGPSKGFKVYGAMLCLSSTINFHDSRVMNGERGQV